MPVTVLVVDDHAGFRRAATALLELDEFEVVGEAADGSSALAASRELRPELVLLDVALPDANGFEIARSLTSARSRVILTSSRQHRDLGRCVRESGAVGFIAKEELSGRALRALLDRPCDG